MRIEELTKNRTSRSRSGELGATFFATVPSAIADIPKSRELFAITSVNALAAGTLALDLPGL